MKKRFKAKVHKKNKIPLLIFLFLMFFMVSFFYVFNRLNIDINDPKVISYLLNVEDREFNIKSVISPEFLLNYTFNAKNELFTTAMSDNDEKNVSGEPLVYIYNTHPTEYYVKSTYEIFNVTPTVITASYILQEYLKNQGIESIVEEGDVTSILREKKWNYAKSYDASRILLEKALKKYPSIEYVIDIHRDAAKKEVSTTTINNESCARISLVVGKDYPDYTANYEFAKTINNKLKEVDSTFSRGVILKSGANVNGVYNQDLFNNYLLIEVGAQYNTIDEVNCALSYFSELYSGYILGN